MRKGWKKAVSTMLCAAMILSMSSFMVSADGEPTIPETPAGDATTEVPGDEKDPADEEKDPADEEKDPADEEKDPADEEKDPADEEKDPADEEKDPADEEKDPADEEKDPADEEKDPADEEKDPSEVSGGPEQPSDSLPMAGLTPAAPAAENGIMTLELSGDGTKGSPYLVSTADDLNEAVENGGYVQLQNNIDISSSGLEISKDVTLDLNGKRLEAANGAGTRILVARNGKLTLRDSAGNGEILTEAKYEGANTGGLIQVAGTFIMESGTIDAASFTSNPVSDGQFAVTVMNGGDVTINGGEIKAGWYAISGNGTDLSGTTITVNGGTLTSTSDYAIYHPQAGTLTINNGSISGGAAGGIAANRGTITINGGTVSCTGNGDTGNAGDGTGNMGNAAINAGAEYGEVTININGGTIQAPNGGDAITVDKAANQKITVNAKNATINGNVDLQNSPDGSSFEFTEVKIDGDVTTGEDTNFEVALTSSSVSGDVTGDNITIDNTTSQNIVATVAGKGYTNLDDALNAAVKATPKTVTLQKDVELNSMLNITQEGVTLDLNGKTITSSDNFDNANTNESHVINVSADGVTIKNGTIKATDKNRHTMQAYKAQNVVLEDLVIDHSGAGEGAPLIVNGSTVTMDGNNSLILNDESWGGINVDPNGETTASLTFGKGSLSFSGNASKPVVWIEAGEEASSTVSGFENVGLISGPDGTYIMNPNRPTPPTSDPDTDRPSGSHSTGSSSSGSNSNVSYTRDPEQDKREAEENMWKRAINKINSARDGSRLKIYTGIVDEIPDYVLDALRENNVTVTFYNQDGDEVTIPAGMAPKSLRDSWTYKQLGNYVLSLDEVVTEVEETTETTQPAAEQNAEQNAQAADNTAKPNPETGDASSSMMAIAAAAASLCGVVLLSKKNK